MDVEGQKKPSCISGDCKTQESESKTETKTADQSVKEEPSKPVHVNGSVNKVNGTADTKSSKVIGTADLKWTGNTTPKRDLTAPTKSSAAKARQPVTSHKPDGKNISSGVRGEKSSVSKSKEDQTSDPKFKDKKGSKESLNSKPTKGDKPGDQTSKGKFSVGDVSKVKNSSKKDKDITKQEGKVSDKLEDVTNSVENKNGHCNDGKDVTKADLHKEKVDAEVVKADSELEQNNRDNTEDLSDCAEAVYIRPEPSAPYKYDIIVKPTTRKGIVTASMATSQPLEPGLDDTDIMTVSDGKIKYINTKYQKVPGRIYDHNCDVKLVVNGSKFKAHRDVLSEASDYFSAMFSHDMKEKEQFVIELKEISPLGFTAMLEYFYHGFITITSENIEDTIEAARFFHVSWILECACHYLIYHMSLENYCAVMALSDKYSLGDLRYEIFKFIAGNLETLTKRTKFYEKVPFELLLHFLMENLYVETSEYFILQMIMKWISTDPENRKENLLALLRQVRFPIMETEELESLTPDILANAEIRESVQQALDYSCNIMNQCMKTDSIYQQRGSHTIITILSFSAEGNYLYYRDPCKAGLTIEELGPCGFFTADYHAMSQTKLGNFLYAAGGYDEDFATTGRVFRFDPRYREWVEVAPMNVPRVSFAMCSSKSKLYAVCGVHRAFIDGNEGPETILNSVESYDPSENSWVNLAPLPVRCFYNAVAFDNNCLYVSGGISTEVMETCPLGNMWCLDLGGTEGWVPKQNMLCTRQGHSLTAYGGKLYAIGGYTMTEGAQNFVDCCENEVYDYETNQWTAIAPTPPQFGHLYRHCDTYDNVIFVLGGQFGNAALVMYDIEKNEWEEVEALGPNVQKLAILDVALP